MLCGISTDFPVLSPTPRQVAHVLLTRPPLRQTSVTISLSPLDLHVLGTPPAFVLSQDQTLKLIFDSLSRILTFSFALTQKNSDCFQRRLLCTSNFHLVIILHCLVFKDQRIFKHQQLVLPSTLNNNIINKRCAQFAFSPNFIIFLFYH